MKEVPNSLVNLVIVHTTNVKHITITRQTIDLQDHPVELTADMI